MCGMLAMGDAVSGGNIIEEPETSAIVSGMFAPTASDSRTSWFEATLIDGRSVRVVGSDHVPGMT